MTQPAHPDLSKIIAFEQGELDQDETIELFQELIDTGLAWQLQGSYGRMADRLLSAGLCMPRGYDEVAWGQRFG